MAPRDIWKYRLILIGLLALIIFAGLLPLGVFIVPGPDLIMCVLFAFVLRRPDYVPLGLVVGVVFLADALLMRPLGLWTLLLLVATEYLRRAALHAQSLTPAEEAAQVAGTMLACFIAERVILFLLIAQTSPLGGQLIHIIMTLVFYPVVAAFVQGVLGVRRLQPGEVDILGSRA